ncbi:glutathione S-transferase GST-6.0 (plasmid) [Pseudosulfitobacter pseudonitzschiae]|uniref:Glutathione S-transferase GST-6.0 n=1 Tax=Pseudosulfitobacter pseudonitzschiae TaxID=1402135 RepID=A0A221K905_9RHOB|nr:MULTISPECIES: glutathione transferase GstA [Roseobacteraceae]ASM75459.1 glutathione S-transferase GST-6.0 [Pseudosulfitobacter pseudonitzschiae]
MKLYFMPGACSLAPHIALREADLPFSLVEVNYQTRLTEGDRNYLEINPKGYVPALELADGELLTELPVILQYVDALAPEAALLPQPGMGRYRALEWLNFIGTEIHKSFSPLFRPTTPEAFLKPGREHLSRRLDMAEGHLRQHRYLSGSEFSLADVYLFTVCRWLGDQDLALATWPALQRHFDDILRRPAVRDALAHEGLTA